MQTRVKDKSDSLFAKFWLIYFFLTIVISGAIIGFCVCVPFYLVGKVSQKAHDLADRMLCRLIQGLLDLQPWLDLSYDVQIPPQTQGGLLLVSNHRSHLDAFILLSRVKGIRILAKKSLFHIPFLGFMMRITGQIPAKRGDVQSYVDAIDIAKQRLRENERVHIFPELTRCEKGFQGTQDFSSLPFRAAISEKAQILPIVFHGTDQVWPKGKMGLAFRSKVRVVSLPAIDSGQFTSSELLKKHVRQLMDQEMCRGLS